MAPSLAHGIKIAPPGRKVGQDFRPYVGSWTASLLQDATRWATMFTRWLQDSPRWLRGGPSWPKMASEGLKMASDSSTIAFKIIKNLFKKTTRKIYIFAFGLHLGNKELQDGSRVSQDGQTWPMMPQDALLDPARRALGPPLKGQGGPQMAPRLAHGLHIAQPGRKVGEDVRPYFGSWTASLLQDATRWPTMFTRWLQESPRWLRGGPSWPKMASRWVKKASRWLQVARRLPLKIMKILIGKLINLLLDCIFWALAF